MGIPVSADKVFINLRVCGGVRIVEVITALGQIILLGLFVDVASFSI